MVAYHTSAYGGNGSEWRLWDWDKITTVVTYTHLDSGTSQGLLCAAHEHGVRVLDWGWFCGGLEPNPSNDPGILLNRTIFDTWADRCVTAAQRAGRLAAPRAQKSVHFPTSQAFQLVPPAVRAERACAGGPHQVPNQKCVHFPTS